MPEQYQDDDQGVAPPPVNLLAGVPRQNLLEGYQKGPPDLGDFAAYAGGQLVKGTGNALLGLVKTPSDVLAGKHDVRDIGPLAADYGVDLALAGAGVPAPPGALRAISAWHGSPHEFRAEPGAPLGRFRDEAIGSGEGAQAFSYGHYLAENKGVGGSYRPAGQGVPADVGGSPLKPADILQKYFEPGQIVPSYSGFDRVVKFNPDQGQGWSVDVRAVKPNNGKNIADLGNPEHWQDTEGARNHATYPEGRNIERVGQARNWEMTQPGSLYNVEVRPDKHELLDWDKWLGEQSTQVKTGLQKLYPEAENDPKHWLHDPFSATGEDIYKALAAEKGGQHTLGQGTNQYTVPYADEPAASKALHEAGVPGVKFLDQQSRGLALRAPTVPTHDWIVARPGGGIVAKGKQADMQRYLDENQTHNLVIFDPSNIKITARNGKALTPVDHDPFGPDLRPVDHVPDFASEAHPKVPEARRAPNGRFYVLDPERPGKYVEVPH